MRWAYVKGNAQSFWEMYETYCWTPSKEKCLNFFRIGQRHLAVLIQIYRLSNESREGVFDIQGALVCGHPIQTQRPLRNGFPQRQWNGVQARSTVFESVSAGRENSWFIFYFSIKR